MFEDKYIEKPKSIEISAYKMGSITPWVVLWDNSPVYVSEDITKCVDWIAREVAKCTD